MDIQLFYAVLFPIILVSSISTAWFVPSNYFSITHIKSESHIRCAVDLASGKLSNIGYDTSWKTLKQHPDSNFRFAGQTIPKFEKCISIVKMLHDQLPFIKCIGWDIVIDSQESIYVLEWNGLHNDIKFSEATQGPCFPDLDWENIN